MTDAPPARSTQLFLTPLATAGALLCTLMLLAGCSGVGDFTFTETSEPTTVQASALPSEVSNLADFSFNINLERELEKRDADAAKAVYLQDVKIRATDGSTGQELGFIDSITIHADSENQSKTRVAWNESVSDSVGRSIDLTTDDNVNLKPYIQEGITMEASASGSPPEEDTTIVSVITLEVEVL